MSKYDLDRIDRKIINELRTDGRLTNVELADKVGLSPSPCLRRLKRLEALGIIKGYQAVVDRGAIGLGLNVFVSLKIATSEDVDVQMITSSLRSINGLVAAYLISGEADYLLHIAVADLDAYERILLGHLLKIPNVRDIRSNFVIRTIAEGLPVIGDS